MSAELTVLALGVLLQFAYFAAYAWYAFGVERQVSARWALSPRDEERPLSGRAARAKRAEANYTHNLLLFAAAAVAVTVSGQSTAFTATCAWLFLAGRVLYLPAYLYGWVPGRSLVWGVSYGATLLLALAALI
jgi:uncharacterized MAPEG superfamily protein